jgi:ribonuclease P protein subunit RPR2
VFAVADTLDALTTNRPYRRASSFAKARSIIVKESGTHFDPEIIAAFEALPDAILEQIKRAVGG